MTTKCTDGGEHDFSDLVEDRDESGAVVGTTFVCTKCGRKVAETLEQGVG